MKVLHVVSSIDPSSGGPAEALRGLATAQVAAGLTVQVVATWTADAPQVHFADQFRGQGVATHLVGPCWGPLKWHRDLKRVVRGAVAEADVVHVHSLWEELQHQAARAARQAGKPYLIRPCGMLDPWSLAQGRFRKRLYLGWRLRRNLNRAAALHFTAQAECDLAAPLRLRAPALVEPNGIALEEFEHLPPRGAFRARRGITAARLLLFLGRLHRKKGLDLLLPAFAGLADRDTVLVLAGPDLEGYKAELEAEVRRLGLADRVLFTGMIQGREKLEALADADLFVLPSYQENFGIAVVEALAAGVPVVISDQVNIHAEISAAGVGGVVPTEAAALAAELGRWLKDGDLRAAAAARARPFVRERYGWDQIARRWVGHYRRLTTSPQSA